MAYFLHCVVERIRKSCGCDKNIRAENKGVPCVCKVSYKKKELLTLREHMGSSLFLVASELLIYSFSFLWCFLFVCLRPVYCVTKFLISASVFRNVYLAGVVLVRKEQSLLRVIVDGSRQGNVHLFCSLSLHFQVSFTILQKVRYSSHTRP